LIKYPSEDAGEEVLEALQKIRDKLHHLAQEENITI